MVKHYQTMYQNIYTFIKETSNIKGFVPTCSSPIIQIFNWYNCMVHSIFSNDKHNIRPLALNMKLIYLFASAAKQARKARKGSLLYLFLKLVQINLIFADNIRILSNIIYFLLVSFLHDKHLSHLDWLLCFHAYNKKTALNRYTLAESRVKKCIGHPWNIDIHGRWFNVIPFSAKHIQLIIVRS
jgi:hypothetical protein